MKIVASLLAKAMVGLLAGLVVGLLIAMHYTNREFTQPPPETPEASKSQTIAR